LREEHTLRIFEKRMPRRKFRPKNKKQQDDGEGCIARSLMV
jgi:hypothetical protein